MLLPVVDFVVRLEPKDGLIGNWSVGIEGQTPETLRLTLLHVFLVANHPLVAGGVEDVAVLLGVDVAPDTTAIDNSVLHQLVDTGLLTGDGVPEGQKGNLLCETHRFLRLKTRFIGRVGSPVAIATILVPAR